ncbi:MAG TPA: chromosome segregation protein SMC, partial [Streptosporangiaceae bacterium]|nr:chromosome segregation protein SMC [Streptosporangiaceae bacterium]
MFRSGQSEYAINGDHCRLLDVQDLLSDSGLGREMHVIVGQGQLDDILHAGPEARRALIEEAAGVLKHRKRKEKALRKLEAMQANLTRLVDLTAELSRRLKPLGRQAEVARKAAVIQAELRDARLRLLADDYVTLAADLARDEADEAAVLARRAALEREVAQARARETELDQAAQQASAVLGRAQETWFALSSLTERLRSTQHLAAQRHTLLTEATAEPDRPGRDPDELDRQADELREEEDGLNERLAAGRQVLAAAAAERAAAEAQLATAERRQAEGAKAAAARANRVARLREQVGAADSRSAAAREEMDRLEVSAAEARERATLAQDQYEDVKELSGGGDEDRSGLAAAHQQAAAELSQYAERVKVLRTAERESARDLAARRARAETLAEAARRGVDASGALLADPARFTGVIGSFAARLRVAEGFEVAIAAALGAAAEARERATLAQDQYEDVQELSGGGDEDRSGLAAAHQQAAAELTQYAERVRVLRTAERESARDLAARRARAETLAEAARRGVDASGALLADPARYSGVIGSFAARLRVAEGFEVAIAAALGAAAEAVAVAGLDAAADILTTLRDADTGSAGLVVAQSPATPSPSDFAVPSAPPVPAGTAIPATELVRAPDGLAEAASELLHDVVVVADLGEARRFVRENPGRRAVTRDGDLLGAFWAQGGGARPQSLFEMRAAADEAAAGLAEAEQRCEEAAEALAAAAEAEEAAREVVAQALARRHEADAAAAEVSGRLGRLAGAARAARDEADRLEASITSARLAAEKDLSRLEQLRQELAEAETAADEPDEPQDDEAREDLAERCVAARNAEMEARLEVRTAEERLRAISGRADSLSATAAAERATRQRAAERRRRQAEQAAVARAVALGARYAVEAAEQSVNLALARRAEAEAASASGAAELKVVRARVRELAADLDTVVNTAHGTEIARAEHRLRLQQLAEHALEEFGVEADALVAEYGPEVPVPVIGDENALPSKFERAAAERRAADASKQLDRLGKVNPLALEEYEALTERHNFLATQLEDLRKTRRDLLTVVKEVDDRVQEVFASAYADTAREFEHLFGRLFPGGQGNLVLTEP